MNSSIPTAEYIFMMCQRIGLPPISTIGLGRSVVSSESRVPSPPARITVFTDPQGSAPTGPGAHPETGGLLAILRNLPAAVAFMSVSPRPPDQGAPPI